MSDFINNRHHAAINASEARRYVERALKFQGRQSSPVDMQTAIDLLEGLAEWILETVEVGK